jgi:adenosylcobinamide kinase/adenosylcobinamide-phosphate guanylyltransferase
MNNIHLILGGARSGKSRLAENLAKQAESQGLNVCYLATAQAHDEEMQQRITQHQADRPQHWPLIESPLYLAKSLEQAIKTSDCVLVDCLTLWLSNCLCQQDSGFYAQQKSALLQFLQSFVDDEQTLQAENTVQARQAKKIIFVSNEVGHGIVPMGELSRQFVDQAGWLHQELAVLASQVDFIMAGLPLNLKNVSLTNTAQEKTPS